VRMCARPAPCRDAHAVLRDYEARDALAASPAARAARAPLPKGGGLRRTYRRDEPRRRVLHLRSSVAALLAVHPPGAAPPAKPPKLPKLRGSGTGGASASVGASSADARGAC
jgi:hypothetical protein